VKSRLHPVAELQGGHTQVSRGGLGHGNALKLDQCRPNLGAICTFLFFLFFHFYWLASVVICSLYADNTDFSSCLQVCIRSEVSHASMHTIDKFPAYPHMPLATCYLLEKMTEPMQVSSAYNCKAFHLMF